MEILTLDAVQFHRGMGNGRTQPLLLTAEKADGTPVDVVTKLRGRELSAKAQTAELVTAALADYLGVAVPQAAVVNVPSGFEAAVPPLFAPAFLASPGPNFGSVHLGPGFTTWLSGRQPPGVQRDQAAAIFAFDLLIQNADREAKNPNLWSTSKTVGVYDHEQAFSFLYLPILGDPGKPWRTADMNNGFRFMQNHVFYSTLRGGRCELGPFETRLTELTNAVIAGLLAPVPVAWREGHDLCEKIGDYLGEARSEVKQFMGLVRHILR